MVLTGCDCGQYEAYYDGNRIEHAKSWAEAETLVRRYKERDLRHVLAGLPPVFWGVHLNGKHCTEGPG